ncbi:M4 family metallopeptidase [Myxococcus sp. RHSTA-1-4]|uniref:M4 family metallopeptidase n=1 Tax=Myxococcus sp. RHSTA-1-4 TaxID=2874601 RepID=UPI001CBD92AF|nr:M4 family metallopeptidase [Myxococcus sp. RHSTA-1-4]MBZ4422578.1 M4 family metallopeptidase [Myxococcus sp. RHSTA-1-4]
MAIHVLKKFGAAWLGLALTACGTVDPAAGDESQSAGQEKGGEDIQDSLGALKNAGVLGVHEDGIPSTIRGELGKVERSVSGMAVGQAAAAASPAVSAVSPVFRLNPADLVLRSVRTDEQGNQHLRYRQTKQGLEVVNGELIVHVRADGTVYAANGSARDGVALSAKPTVDAAAAAFAAVRATAGNGIDSSGSPRLVYVRDEAEKLHLAWEVRVTGERDGMPLVDLVYVNARGGDVVARHPQIHSAINRKVYSANNGTSTPGTLKRSEGQAATGDSHVDTNYDMLGLTYNCYNTLFGRDSFDNAGATLISTVHYSSSYVNAYWDGTQMVYGDGDGVNSIELGKDADVTVHELTHAVTERESNLTYSGQSGGLNEAMSDTFAAICESWQSGTWSTASAIWMIGEDIWTPGTANDALRYMDDPAKDGVSKDWAANVTSSTDVHYSSGVPNLAFALLSKGGVHPRGRSTINVPAIGVEKAARIWYKANVDLFTASTTFAQAKTWTIQAAADLGYDTATQDAVKAAWEAVGVGVATPPPTTTALSNGVPVTSLSDSAGGQKFFTLAVPSGSSSLTFTISGGTGDADLYVRFGAAPDSSTYDCRPYQSGNSETCTITNIQAGTYYVMLNAYSAYSGVTLTGTYGSTPPPTGNVLTNGVPVTGLSGASSSTVTYTMAVPANTAVTFTISGGTGDADMYVRFGSAPTTSTYDCRPYKSGNAETCTLTKTTAGTYYVMLRGYSAYSGVTLKGQY